MSGPTLAGHERTTERRLVDCPDSRVGAFEHRIGSVDINRPDDGA
jgi:hypothetical protein